MGRPRHIADLTVGRADGRTERHSQFAIPLSRDGHELVVRYHQPAELPPPTAASLLEVVTSIWRDRLALERNLTGRTPTRSAGELAQVLDAFLGARGRGVLLECSDLSPRRMFDRGSAIAPTHENAPRRTPAGQTSLTLPYEREPGPREQLSLWDKPLPPRSSPEPPPAPPPAPARAPAPTQAALALQGAQAAPPALRERALAASLEPLGWTLKAVDIDPARGVARVEVDREGRRVTLDVRNGRGTVTREQVAFDERGDGRGRYPGLWDAQLLGRSKHSDPRDAVQAFAEYIVDNAKRRDPALTVRLQRALLGSSETHENAARALEGQLSLWERMQPPADEHRTPPARDVAPPAPSTPRRAPKRAPAGDAEPFLSRGWFARNLRERGYATPMVRASSAYFDLRRAPHLEGLRDAVVVAELLNHGRPEVFVVDVNEPSSDEAAENLAARLVLELAHVGRAVVVIVHPSPERALVALRRVHIENPEPSIYAEMIGLGPRDPNAGAVLDAMEAPSLQDVAVEEQLGAVIERVRGSRYGRHVDGPRAKFDVVPQTYPWLRKRESQASIERGRARAKREAAAAVQEWVTAHGLVPVTDPRALAPGTLLYHVWSEGFDGMGEPERVHAVRSRFQEWDAHHDVVDLHVLELETGVESASDVRDFWTNDPPRMAPQEPDGVLIWNLGVRVPPTADVAQITRAVRTLPVVAHRNNGVGQVHPDRDYARTIQWAAGVVRHGGAYTYWSATDPSPPVEEPTKAPLAGDARRLVLDALAQVRAAAGARSNRPTPTPSAHRVGPDGWWEPVEGDEVIYAPNAKPGPFPKATTRGHVERGGDTLGVRRWVDPGQVQVDRPLDRLTQAWRVVDDPKWQEPPATTTARNDTPSAQRFDVLIDPTESLLIVQRFEGDDEEPFPQEFRLELTVPTWKGRTATSRGAEALLGEVVSRVGARAGDTAELFILEPAELGGTRHRHAASIELAETIAMPPWPSTFIEYIDPRADLYRSERYDPDRPGHVAVNEVPLHVAMPRWEEIVQSPDKVRASAEKAARRDGCGAGAVVVVRYGSHKGQTRTLDAFTLGPALGQTSDLAMSSRPRRRVSPTARNDARG